MNLVTDLSDIASSAIARMAAGNPKPLTMAPASWRGVKFGVVDTATGGGRRLAIHQYPGREDPWTEDMGGSVDRYQLRGFVLDGSLKLGGGTIAMQRASLIAACRLKGSGKLAHPTLGSLTVVLERWRVSEALDADRFSEVELEFVDAGKQEFPVSSPTNAGSKKAISKLKSALLVDAVQVIGKLASGQPITALSALGMAAGLLGVAGVRADLIATAAGWAGKVIVLARDATSLVRLTAVLPGNNGRFSPGGNSGLTGSNRSSYSSATTVTDLISAASVQRVAVATAAANFEMAASTTDLANPVDLQPSATALVDSLVASCADPADAIRLLLQLLGETIGANITQTSYAISQLVQRAAAGALCEVSASYQPASANDAALRIAQIGDALDNLALSASAMGDAGSAAALGQCRGAVAQDLRERGATLAQVRTFDRATSLPALALAQSIYGDSSRADQLVAQARPESPLFLPVSFQALAS